MFHSILISTELTAAEILICSASALVCGLILSLAYKSAAHASKAFALASAFLPMIVMSVIMMVNGNLGVGVAVAGSFSLVRFRSLPGKASDIAVIFLAMGAGLACGMGYVTFALAMTVMITGTAYLLAKTSLFSQPETLRYLMITIPEDLDYAGAFADIFGHYTKNAKLTGMRTVNLGALYELRYEITLKDVTAEKEMLDMIRTRNGNLTIQSSLLAPAGTEL